MAQYSKKAGEKVEQAMHEMHEGTLKSGRSGKKVTDPKQAIAIGLSEVREEGVKVPKEATTTKAAGTAKKTAAKKEAAPEKAAAEKAPATKRTATVKKSTAAKSAAPKKASTAKKTTAKAA